MKEFFQVMKKDILGENFSSREIVMYGVVAPIVLVAILGVAGWVETLV